MKFVAVLPARYKSSRFPGKPLAMIDGKPMIYYAYTTVSRIPNISDCYVATDDERIYNTVCDFGGKAILTGEFNCGTDRVQWASKDLDADVIINVQGDEPLIKPQMIESLMSAFEDERVVMATLKKKIEEESELNNPNVVKVITTIDGDAIYFSRYCIPFDRDKKHHIDYFKHIGVYAYRKDFLAKIVNMPQTILEKAESLEQLRVIENGYKIRVIETPFETRGVDTPEQLTEVEKIIRGDC